MPVSIRAPRLYLPKDGHDAEPIWEVQNKSKPGKRPPTLRDAKAALKECRDRPWLPSVTSIMDIIAKPGLRRWINEQYIAACYENPREPMESLSEYTDRVAKIAESRMAEAADLGSEFHHRAELLDRENAIRQPSSLFDEKKLELMMGGYRIWTRKHVLLFEAIERTFGSVELGYAGRFDRLLISRDGHRVVADIKTTSTKMGRKVTGYPEWGEQLVAYARGIGEPPTTRLWNVVVSSSEMGRVEIVDWTGQQSVCWRNFSLALEIWISRNQYDPRLPRGKETDDEDQRRVPEQVSKGG